MGAERHGADIRPHGSLGRLAVVPLKTEPSVTFGTASNLPSRLSGDRISNQPRAFDILPDGSFIGLVAPSESDSTDSTSVPQIEWY